MTAPEDDEKPPAGGEPIASRLAGWFQKAVQGGSGPLPQAPAAGLGSVQGPGPGSPPGSVPGSPPGPLPGSGPGSGPLAPANRPGAASSLRLPGAGPARSASGPLPAPSQAPPLAPPSPGPAGHRASPTGELKPVPSAATPGADEDPAVASRRRMAFIVAYMKDPTGDPDFSDKPLVYRILSEERAHQQALIAALQEDLRRLAGAAPADDAAAARREDLEGRLKTAQNRQAQLFLQLKKLTGVKGKTGGTGFLAAADLPAGPPVPSPRPGGSAE